MLAHRWPWERFEHLIAAAPLSRTRQRGSLTGRVGVRALSGVGGGRAAAWAPVRGGEWGGLVVVGCVVGLGAAPGATELRGRPWTPGNERRVSVSKQWDERP